MVLARNRLSAAAAGRGFGGIDFSWKVMT